MSEINQRIDAFPHEAGIRQTGMELRDYFAAKVLVPVLTGAVFPTPEDRTKGCAMVAEFAYLMADAMLEARK